MVMEAAMQRQIDGAQETYASMSEEIHHLREGNAELIEALQKVMSWVDNWSPEFTQDQEWIDDEPRIRSVIAKAPHWMPVPKRL